MGMTHHLQSLCAFGPWGILYLVSFFGYLPVCVLNAIILFLYIIYIIVLLGRCFFKAMALETLM